MIISTLLAKHADGRQAYQPVYDEFFTDEFCNRVKTILEIGIQYGIGLRSWLELFPNANVYGFDIRGVDIPDDVQHNPRLLIQRSCDSSIPASVDGFFGRIGNVKMDVIIDDADHQKTSQLPTLKNFYPHLAGGGLYVIEDTGPLADNNPFVQEIRRSVNGEVHVRSVSNISGLIVIHAA